jgi:hypothetical protein
VVVVVEEREVLLLECAMRVGCGYGYVTAM